MQVAYLRILLIMFLAFSSQVFSEKSDDKDFIHEILTQNSFIKGHFKQERMLEGIARPIKSSGRYAIWRNNGIYWETNQPLFQATSFLKDCVYYWPDENTFSQEKDGVFQINEKISQLMLAFFTADFDRLEMDFHANWKNEKDIWSVVLTPANVYIGKAIKQVTIKGAEHIETVTLELATGDSTTLWLSISGEGDTPDTESENKIFPEKTHCK